jgi:general secretion pathway protein K
MMAPPNSPAMGANLRPRRRLVPASFAQASRAAGAPPRQQGIALVAVLWLTILLTVIASSFAYSMRGQALAARNALSTAQARAYADGAVERMAFELQRPRNLAAAWVADGQARSWQDGDAAITATAVDESAKIDINAASDPLLRGLFVNVAGMDAASAAALVDAMLDWKDADDLRRPNGAEEPDYRAAGRKYRPANAPFETPGELQRVLGMTPEIYARIADTITVYSRQAGINTQTASRDVLLALPNATPELVDGFLQQRGDALAANLKPAPFIAAQGMNAQALPVWRIRAQSTMPDGVTFVREAVLRPSGNPRRPMIALLWQEGSVIASAAPAGTDTAAAAAIPLFRP